MEVLTAKKAMQMLKHLPRPVHPQTVRDIMARIDAKGKLEIEKYFRESYNNIVEIFIRELGDKVDV